MEGKSDEDANVFTDTGWFTLDATRVPTGDDLAALQTSVGDTSLDPPDCWEPVVDPTVVQKHVLSTKGKDADERNQVVSSFMTTLTPNKFPKKVKVIEVSRIQNLAMWQSYCK